MEEPMYLPEYSASWALVIGINDYEKAPPLGYARQDAEAFADSLQSRFGFPSEAVTCLYDEAATKEGILRAFLRHAEDPIAENDRLAVFFAGHGCTRSGRRGEVGYLVPWDGDAGDLASLIRWDELTHGADLIPAKHVLFIMDACYGGLAITRSLPPGSSRFLRSMLRRYARQVLTAGKADETVADSGGPRSGHSVFTGHLLDALDGAAATTDGIISANNVMAYVYNRVATDQHSAQTPHYGFLAGDGDFIFAYPRDELPSSGEEGTDVLVEVSAELPQTLEEPERALTDDVKEYLSEPRFKIRLDDLVSGEVRAATYALRAESFPSRAPVTTEAFAQRLEAYERELARLLKVTVLLSRWGSEQHRATLTKIVARLAQGLDQGEGSVVWLGLRWYPIELLLYCGGMAAISGDDYRNLAALLLTPLSDRQTGRDERPAVLSSCDGLLEVERHNMFKTLPGHERYYVPRSEYLFERLQPIVEDLLFLGSSYEKLFDRFETLLALIYADLLMKSSETRHVWGPPGRFAWKEQHGHGPYRRLLAEARQSKDAWGPLQAGLFDGSLERFEEVWTAYRDHLLANLHWF